MKKTKLNAAKLQLTKEKIGALTQEQTQRVQGKGWIEMMNSVRTQCITDQPSCQTIECLMPAHMVAKGRYVHASDKSGLLYSIAFLKWS